MSSYMHIIEACPTQAAWLRWNIWIIYHLQSALPHFRKFSQQSRKIIHVICIFGKGGAKTKYISICTLLLFRSLFHPYYFSPHFCLIFSCYPTSLFIVLSSLLQLFKILYAIQYVLLLVLSNFRTLRWWSTQVQVRQSDFTFRLEPAHWNWYNYESFLSNPAGIFILS